MNGIDNQSHLNKKQQSELINYLKEWNAVGFRSPSMHHNLDWLHRLNIEYDSSTFDTDPFEPQSDGIEHISIFCEGQLNKRGLYRTAYTLSQDFTLYVLMRERTTDVWKRKLDWIAEHGGMALLNTHPDYMCFKGKKPGLEEYLPVIMPSFYNI